MTRKQRKSSRPNPKAYREFLQSQFAVHLYRNETFASIAMGLRPLWRTCVADSYDSQLLMEMPFELIPGSSSAQRTYRAAIEWTVSEKLGCKANGLPAVWVSDALHSAVRESRTVRIPEPDTQIVKAEMKLAIATSFAGIAITINGNQIGEMQRVPSPESLGSLPTHEFFTAFQYWDELRTATINQLDILISEAKGRLDAVSESWGGIYEKGHKARTGETMENLVARLVDGDSLFSSDRTQAHRLMVDMGLDTPKKS